MAELEPEMTMLQRAELLGALLDDATEREIWPEAAIEELRKLAKWTREAVIVLEGAFKSERLGIDRLGRQYYRQAFALPPQLRPSLNAATPERIRELEARMQRRPGDPP